MSKKRSFEELCIEFERIQDAVKDEQYKDDGYGPFDPEDLADKKLLSRTYRNWEKEGTI